MTAHVAAMGVERLPAFALFRDGVRLSLFSANLSRIGVLRAEISANKDCVDACAMADRL